MAIAQPGQTFTFQVQYLDGVGAPIVVTDANIEVFAFDGTGAKVTIVAAGAPMSPVVGDAGRYLYVYNVQDPWTYQPTMYGVMRGTDPTTGLDVAVELEVNITTPAGGGRGLIAQFVRGG
jgi:hypothetical protein